MPKGPAKPKPWPKKPKPGKGQRPTFVSLLLDETGSMSSCVGATIEGVNSYLDQTAKQAGDVKVTMVKFNNYGITDHCVAARPKDVRRLSPVNYKPSGTTPLLDAVMTLIDRTERAIAEAPGAQVFLVVTTDGEENCSEHATFAQVAARVAEKAAAGWNMVFLGADMDAWPTASRMGFAAGSTATYGKGEVATRNTYTALAGKTFYAASGVTGQAVSGFDEAERRAMVAPDPAPPANPARPAGRRSA